jgi:flagellar basal-body rod protein FlgF
MDRALYIAMVGAREAFHAQAATAHNLANTGTVGFRADMVVQRSMPVFGSGLDSRVYSLAERGAIHDRPGVTITTGKALDVAIDGDGWIVTQREGGVSELTRSSELHVSPDGMLTTGQGAYVMGETGPISVPPSENIEIGFDGTVSIRPLGGSASELEQLDRISLVRMEPGSVIKDVAGRMVPRNGVIPEPDGEIRIRSGILEGSNVSAVEELVSMIELTRQFEMQVKMMSEVEDAARASDQLLKAR